MNYVVFYTVLTVVLSIGAFSTYSKELKASYWGLPVFLLVSNISSYLWYYAATKTKDSKEMMFVSLVWDVIMVILYYIFPMMYSLDKLNWQVPIASSMVIIGLFWLKSAFGH